MRLTRWWRFLPPCDCQIFKSSHVIQTKPCWFCGCLDVLLIVKTQAKHFSWTLCLIFPFVIRKVSFLETGREILHRKRGDRVMISVWARKELLHWENYVRIHQLINYQVISKSIKVVKKKRKDITFASHPDSKIWKVKQLISINLPIIATLWWVENVESKVCRSLYLAFFTKSICPIFCNVHVDRQLLRKSVFAFTEYNTV